MSIHINDLRDIAANRGLGVCDLAADEIEDLEKAYALLFAENTKIRAASEAAPTNRCTYPLCSCEEGCDTAQPQPQTEDRKLLEQALDALEWNIETTNMPQLTNKAIAALRVRLERGNG